MKKIDRLGWADGISFTAYGVRVGIRVSNPTIMHRIPDLLPPSWKPARSGNVERLYSLVVGGAGSRPSVRRFNVLYADADRMSRTMDLEPALKLLETDLQLYVAEAAPRRIFVHAGVVRWRGRAILIPGRSLSGKSTLVNELIKAGATYYSDEYAVCDARGRVHPYPKPLALRKEGDVVPKPVRAGTMPGRRVVKPLPVGLVVLTSYRSGARWRPRRLSHGRAVIELLNHTIPARMEPGRALATLKQVAAGTLVLKGVRGEAGQMIDTLLARADEHASGIANGPTRRSA